MIKSELYLGDCVEALKQYKDNHFSLAIVDPPYGIGESHIRTKSRTKLAKCSEWDNYHESWDKETPPIEYFKQLERVSKNQIIWGANHMMDKIQKSSSCWLVWYKDNTGGFADCELAYTSFSTAVRFLKYRWNGMIQEDMKNKEVRIHPTQKPVALYKWILKNYAKPGDTILDTHVGSGSSRIACFDMRFEFTGYENDKKHYNDSQLRFQQHISQLQLFRS